MGSNSTAYKMSMCTFDSRLQCKDVFEFRTDVEIGSACERDLP